MKSKKQSFTVFGAALLSASFIWLSGLLAQASTNLININFYAGQVAGPGGAIKTGLAATGFSTNDVWNHYGRTNPDGSWRINGALAGLEYSDGSISAAGLTISNADGEWLDGSSDPMYNTYLYPLAGGNLTVYLTNLPAARYDFYVYNPDGNYHLTVGSTDYGTRTTLDSPLANPPVWQEAKQYALFRDVPVDPSQPVTVLVRPGVYGYAVISGIQILGKNQTVTNAPPSILVQPASQTVVVGTAASLSVTASGTPPLSYQWRFGGNEIPGANSSSLNFASVGPDQTGGYDVIVSNSSGIVTSSVANLTVVLATHDASQDFSLSANPNGLWTYGVLSNFAGNLTILPFSRTFGADNGVPIGQWYLANDFQLMISKVLGPGTAVSAAGAFVGPAGTVYFAPGLEGTLQNFAAIRFTVPSGGAGSYQVQTAVQPLFNGAVSADADFHVTKNGQEIFGQNLLPNQGTGYTNTLQLSDGDRIDFAIGRGPDGIRNPGTGLKIQAILAQTSSVSPPAIVVQPQSQVSVVGSNATLTVQANGAPPLIYQWYLNGSPVNGGTGSLLTLAQVQPAQAGGYTVVITNSFGAVTSTVANLTLALAIHDVSQDFSLSPNPNGVWTYGVLSNFAGNLTVLPFSRTFGADNGVPIGQWYLANDFQLMISKVLGPGTAVSAGGAFVGPAGTVYFAPGLEGAPQNFAAIRFTVPSGGAGSYQVQTAVQPLFNGAVSADADFHVTKNGQEIFGQNLLPNQGTGYTNTLQLSDGDRIDFGIGRGPDGIRNPGTGLKIQATVAQLAIAPPSVCAPVPSGLVAWWKADGNGVDSVAGNNAYDMPNVTFTPGEVGQAFAFDPIGPYWGVKIADQPAYVLTNSLSVECWIRPRANGYTIFFRGDHRPGLDPYFLTMGGGSTLYFYITDEGGNSAFVTAPLVFNQWWHVAGTLDGSSGTLSLYTNGVMASQMITTIRPMGELISSETPGIGIGNVNDGGPSGFSNNFPFVGDIDEVSLYNRALSSAEVQAIYAAGSTGKCPDSIPPVILEQPTDQAVQAGNSVTFAAAAAGSPPLTYQWRKGGSNIPGATLSAYTIAQAQISDDGTYSVAVSNHFGWIVSSGAVLLVTSPPALVEISNVTATAGGPARVPIMLVANGNENALMFSLDFDPARLAYRTISARPGVSLLVNSSQASSGILGVGLALSPGTVFSRGTQQVALVSFSTPIETNLIVTPISFGDVPVARELADVSGALLPALYTDGTVTLPAADFEGDVSPRPGGDRNVDLRDWVLVGRYVAGLDSPTNASEFQRADCAPRSTLGNGRLTVADWVQAGRYALRLDPPTVAGGPTGPFQGTNLALLDSKDNSSRQVMVANVTLGQGQSGTVPVNLSAQGNETALGFALSFDASQLSYQSATLGDAASGATLIVNSTQAAAGRLGVLVALPSGANFAPGTNQIVNLTFRTAPAAAGTFGVSLMDTPVMREVSDAGASALPTSYVNGSITLNPPPSLSIALTEQAVNLSWPAWATNFVLESLGAPLSPSAIWTNVPGTVIRTPTNNQVTLPMGGVEQYYRLRQQ